MAKSKVTTEVVEAAIAALKEKGDVVNLKNIRNLTGGGSWGTLLRLKKEINEAELAAKDSQAALAAFRPFYAVCSEEGRAQRQQEVADLSETVELLTADVTTWEFRAVEAQRGYDEMVIKNRAMEEKLREALETSMKLVQARDDNARRIDILRKRLNSARMRLSTLENQAKPSSEQLSQPKAVK